MSRLSETGIDLGRKGVVWLEGEPLAVERTGAARAVANLAAGEVSPAAADRSQVVAASFGEGAASAVTPTDLLAVGGKRKKDALEAIDRWYRRQARAKIERVTAVEAERLGLHPERIMIRDQKTRWGSCSTSGTLSFNWRLIIGPEHALRYVVIHELVHIEHHNHSRRFWNALTEALPDWKRSALWLRVNERALTAYRPRI